MPIVNIEHDNCVMQQGEEKMRLNAKELEAIFDNLVNIGSKHKPTAFELNLARATGGKRADWNAARREIISSSNANAKSLEMIESAILHVTLEDEVDLEDENGGVDANKFSRALCTGSGKKWFDKSVSLAIFKNGLFGAGYDHSWGDGAVTMNIYEKVIQCEATIGYDENERVKGTSRQGWAKHAYVSAFYARISNARNPILFAFPRIGYQVRRKA